MPEIPDIVYEAWENHEGPVVLITVDSEGIPNAIYVKSVRIFNKNTFVIADNYFNKTRVNILIGSKAALLFINKEAISFQIKGKIEYHTEGALFDFMKQWNPARHPGHAAAVLEVEHVFSGAEKLV